eukprot:229458-Pelagomonas_calceolata.AAC.1
MGPFWFCLWLLSLDCIGKGGHGPGPGFGGCSVVRAEFSWCHNAAELLLAVGSRAILLAERLQAGESHMHCGQNRITQGTLRDALQMCWRQICVTQSSVEELVCSRQADVTQASADEPKTYSCPSGPCFACFHVQVPPGEATQQLSELDAAVLAQERSLAEAAYYLPSFDQKRCSVTAQVRTRKSVGDPPFAHCPEGMHDPAWQTSNTN